MTTAMTAIGSARVLAPYLQFDGRCREAMTFYQECLGGELTMLPFEGEGDADGERLMHSYLNAGPIVLMAADSPPGWSSRLTSSMSLSLHCEDAEELDRLFALFALDGSGFEPPHEAFWGGRFAMVTDRFGTTWMLTA